MTDNVHFTSDTTQCICMLCINLATYMHDSATYLGIYWFKVITNHILE